MFNPVPNLEIIQLKMSSSKLSERLNGRLMAPINITVTARNAISKISIPVKVNI
jgi:hypothetical protein